MKKMVLIGIVVSFFFIGCANSQPEPNTESGAVKNVKEVVKRVKKVLDPCERDKLTCISQCKINYPTENDNLKLKACVAKCYTFFAGCKTAEGAKKGYKKTKEIGKRVYENTKDFINEHTN